LNSGKKLLAGTVEVSERERIVALLSKQKESTAARIGDQILHTSES
jgi:hypothetical protein